jgi:hypothetical protein
MDEIKNHLKEYDDIIPDGKEDYTTLTYITLRFLCSILKRILYEKNIEGFIFTPKKEILYGFEIVFPCLENGIIHPIEKVFIGLKSKPDDTFMQNNLNYVTGNWLIRPFRNNSSKYFSIYHIEEYEYDVIKDFNNFDINGLVEEILNLFNTPYLSLDEYTEYKNKDENEEI